MSRRHTPENNTLEHLGTQTFHVDPRAQGFNLSAYPSLDGYANKFLSLTEPGGMFISPRIVPDWLLDYYAAVDFATADPETIITLPTDAGIDDIQANAPLHKQLSRRAGDLLIPYMATESVETTANTYGMRSLGSAAAIRAMADKAVFQQALRELSPDIKRETGFDIAIPAYTFAAGNRNRALNAYRILSNEGSADVVAIKPQSASALGIFVVRACEGLLGLEAVLDAHFQDDEQVLLEAFILHNHSPSMQGLASPDQTYRHLYFGRQLVSVGTDGRVGYDGSQTPFDFKETRVSRYDLDRMQAVHQIVGKQLVASKGIQGIAGFDSIANIMPDGHIQDFKLAELNLHLPGSISVYAATNKLFPKGFEGVAHNITVPLHLGQTALSFFNDHQEQMIQQPHTYGLFPINASYDDKIDIIAFGKDIKHTESLLQGITR